MGWESDGLYNYWLFIPEKTLNQFPIDTHSMSLFNYFFFKNSPCLMVK